VDFSHLVHAVARRLLRAPALHYAVLGALLFVAVSPRGAAPPATRLVVPASRVEAALREYERLKRQPLTPAERQSIIQLLADQEVLYAYALRLGLAKDPVVERRLSQIATFVSENPHEAKSPEELANEAVLLGLNEGDLIVRRVLIDGARRLIRAAVLIREPSDSLLEQYLHEHADEFRLPARVRLSHVLVDPRIHKDQTEHDARELLARLRADSVPPEQAAEYGDQGLVAANLAALPQVELERRFGHRFVEQLAGLPVGGWDGPISSRYGLHLIFVQERIPERVASLAEVRNDVRAQVRNKLADEWLQIRLGQLRAEFQVEVQDTGSPRGRS
jgi:parvulin-like peptidyl-prolyl cis-trans isomerase-like protein